jgi:isocitrate/isopropylmalate dehydrogenase
LLCADDTTLWFLWGDDAEHRFDRPQRCQTPGPEEDIACALAGSLGLAASANLNPERRFPSMFEPVHGSAPDIAGQGLANPIGAVGSAALMLEHFGLPDQAARLNKAIEATTAAGILTRDVGGTATTEDVVKALIDALNA